MTIIHLPNDIERYLIDSLVKVATAHAERNGIGLSTVGIYAFNDARFFSKLMSDSNGKIALRQWSRCLQWIYDRWPTTEPWPKDVIRPARRNPIEDRPAKSVRAPLKVGTSRR